MLSANYKSARRETVWQNIAFVRAQILISEFPLTRRALIGSVFGERSLRWEAGGSIPVTCAELNEERSTRPLTKATGNAIGCD